MTGKSRREKVERMKCGKALEAGLISSLFMLWLLRIAPQAVKLAAETMQCYRIDLSRVKTLLQPADNKDTLRHDLAAACPSNPAKTVVKG